jgi:two-component system NtrC family sensor kinase
MKSGNREGESDRRAKDLEALHSTRHYRRLWKIMVISTSVVALVPLLILTIISYYQLHKTFRLESINPIHNLTATTKHSLDFFLSERVSALRMVIESTDFEDLSNDESLARMLANMKQAFGGFVDLGLIESDGKQLSYAGPYNLEGKNYADQDWFNFIGLREVHISEVFLGHRNYPHFVIAVKHTVGSGDFYVLRATIDSERLYESIIFTNLNPSSDAFLINKEGMMQSPSRFYGGVLQQCPLSIPPVGIDVQVIEKKDEAGRPIIMGYAPIEHSPFILVLIRRSGELMGYWATLRTELFGFVALSACLILLVVIYGATYLARRVRTADVRRVDIFHKMEYTNKLAAIGRLGAGVAHEINNPLAIINQKAGLMKDLVLMTEGFAYREKFLDLINGILTSVDRCSTITHRLLGFAKHMDIHVEEIHLELLLKEVFGFLEKEALHRNFNVTFHVDDRLPMIESDRGQLQQVFLNILNNAFAAVDDGGSIDVSIVQVDDQYESVAISDNGSGISESEMTHIFEPFFTTKKSGGTGLGLSITYGIVEKLRGKIGVESEIGKGTKFTVILPIKQER